MMHLYRWLNTQFLILLAMGLLLFALISLASNQAVAAEQKNSSAQLQAKYQALTEQLASNQFQRPLYMNSTESSNSLKGEIYAVVEYPFSTVNLALNNPSHWCEALILHINIKYCRAAANQQDTALTVYLGKKEEQALADAHRIDFACRTLASTPDYFALELYSEQGPIGTSHYRILVEATTLKTGRTFLHFSYGYQFGLTGKIGMQGYLSTVGKNKVGFTTAGKDANGEPIYLKGVRGIVERNTMRYYLAIDSYLATFLTKGEEVFAQRLQHWYNSNELYQRQLHEVERNDYMALKQREYVRQQTTP